MGCNRLAIQPHGVQLQQNLPPARVRGRVEGRAGACCPTCRQGHQCWRLTWRPPPHRQPAGAATRHTTADGFALPAGRRRHSGAHHSQARHLRVRQGGPQPAPQSAWSHQQVSRPTWLWRQPPSTPHHARPPARPPPARLTPQLVLESSPYPCACCTYHFQLDPPQLQQPAEDGATPREASLAAGEGVNPAGVNPAAAGAGTWVMVVDSLPMIRLDGCHSLEQLLAANAASA